MFSKTQKMLIDHRLEDYHFKNRNGVCQDGLKIDRRPGGSHRCCDINGAVLDTNNVAEVAASYMFMEQVNVPNDEFANELYHEGIILRTEPGNDYWIAKFRANMRLGVNGMIWMLVNDISAGGQRRIIDDLYFVFSIVTELRYVYYIRWDHSVYKNIILGRLN